ncbi:MAG: hypothetical protein JWN70_6361 [Planctomycetaceae bacterium]|nr:hypothetical protein [Planctomycetaceae bacterium]
MYHDLSRRQFLKTSAVGSCALMASLNLSVAADAATPRIDTHLHCFAGRDNAKFPYHARATYIPEEVATPEHLLQCMTDAKVDYAIVVHPEPYQDDLRYLEHCLQVGKGKLKGTALVFADRDGSLKQLPDLCRRVPIVAVRVHAYLADRLPPFGKPELQKLWKMATDLNLAVQLHFQPQFAAGFEPYIKEFPKTTVIIDHLGRPFGATPEANATVMGWSKYDNTVMKLSSIPEVGMQTQQEIAVVIRKLTDAWGAERMIYGGGFNGAATGRTYAAAFETARSYIAHLSADDQAKLLGGTAQKLFRFGS